MRAIYLDHHDRPDLACRLLDVAEPTQPGPGDVIIALKASAINPADLLSFEGRYPGPATLPAPVGIEGAGIVTAVGDEVTGIAIGDHVMSMGRANWAEQVMGPAGAFIPLPKALPWHLAAQMKANPPSALLMLTKYKTLNPGEYVVQNAANSAVGRHVIRMAKARGLRSINIVRRESLVDELAAIGADHVIVDQDDLGAVVRDRIGKDASVPLGIDAIGGVATSRIADCLSRGGTVVNYGFLSGEPCQFAPMHTVVRGLTLTGFWLVDFLQNMPPQEVAALFQDLAGQFIRGELLSPVEASYDLSDGIAAIAHAARESRDGKVLLTANQD